jgi:hypothetical protein
LHVLALTAKMTQRSDFHTLYILQAAAAMASSSMQWLWLRWQAVIVIQLLFALCWQCMLVLLQCKRMASF